MLYVSGVHLSRSPLAKLRNIKEIKIVYSIYFFFCLKSLKPVEGGKYIYFHLKYLFCRYLDSAARGGSATPPPPQLRP